eukprot:m.58601 g.58601  ORF g.58601 m.58601 type:complete len:54 (+) comp11187_c0_seq3:1147-1308(+)
MCGWQTTHSKFIVASTWRIRPEARNETKHQKKVQRENTMLAREHLNKLLLTKT